MLDDPAPTSARIRPTPLPDIETPAVIVDRVRLERNIAAGATIARDGRVALRPHVKTHKSVRLARLQMLAGASGLTVAKSSEALVFIAAGLPAVTVAYPLLDGAKIFRVLRAAQEKGTALRLIADSEVGVDAIAREAAALGVTADVQIKVDVGLHRCGVDPVSAGALILARRIADAPSLHFGGLVSHAGHAYGAAGPDAVRAIARAERETMLRLAERLCREGLSPPSISVGSTPTVWKNGGFDGISEVRPGNYVFMDLTQVALGLVPRQDLALSVLATVVSCNDTYAIVDAGSKVLSSDRGPHGSTLLDGYGLATRPSEPDAPDMPVTKLSEEHGFVAHGGRRPALGERLQIFPNHACTVVNLAHEFLVLDESGVVESWPVDAQGRVS